MRKIWAIPVILLLLPMVVAASQQDDLSILFNSWLEGKPKALIKLNVEIPKVEGAEKCFLAVHRFPTPYNPTKDPKHTEIVYRGVVPCGSTITVKNFINMIQAGAKVEKGEIKAVYDSPEYAVVVITSNGYSFSRILQTSVEKPITDLNIKAELKKPEATLGKVLPSSKDLLGAAESSCSITVGPDGTGYCAAKTKLTYLNSIPGLSVSFRLVDTSPPSAMYLEGWGAACATDSDPSKPCPAGFWGSQGKKLTYSTTGESTASISGGQRAIVWGSVLYKYEHWVYEDYPVYYVYDFLYPQEIAGLLPLQMDGYYQEPSPLPGYARGPFVGSRSINFWPVYDSDNKLPLSTSISVGISVPSGPYSLSLSISVSPYEAGSVQYDTPRVDVNDISGKDYGWYWWWYKDNDAMTYEVQFGG
ncbi:MAG: hypothetical protein DSO07_13040 [Thermoproteota archaeon]|jgi:hypothetical protein|uniref:Uncharacterized protein n=1 Tax=Candidatus Methanodesulfokora washburnensis TaxID=2478471 RepID=A0A429GF53_9CREN|nr:hypothetical protein [Candidatus Methanodesulfokores washburnensis]RSN72395.1 hypothetical protein D6D85_13995 [Candidatus Methanodesulfokores washburnensis]TDA36986.1 MAG: hypothetical protein DSO07_13040 [Candidatus Korarchaeota archaeon]